MKAVAGSKAPGEIADSAIGVTPAAIGVCPSSPAKYLAFAPWSPKEVMSFSAEAFAILRCGPLFMPGGDSGGLSTSGMLEFMAFRLPKLSWAAEGEVHGSEDSLPMQARLSRTSGVSSQ